MLSQKHKICELRQKQLQILKQEEEELKNIINSIKTEELNNNQSPFGAVRETLNEIPKETSGI